jgi:hypothetical protein
MTDENYLINQAGSVASAYVLCQAPRNLFYS